MDYNQITDLITKPIDFVIILIETTSENVGHWLALFRYDNIIEFNNTYGEASDVQKTTSIRK